MSNIVLVHGSFVDERCWQPVVDLLEADGHRVETPRLHRGSLALDTAAVQEVVDDIDGPVVVCGWSYAGVVITGLELPEGSHLVYLCAVMPDHGESLWSLAGEDLSAPGEEDVVIDVDDEDKFVISGPDVDLLFWADAPEDLRATARESLHTQVVQTFFDPPARIAWHTTPSTYVLGRDDRVFRGEVAELMSSRADHRLVWDTSHSPNLSQPDRVAELLAGL